MRLLKIIKNMIFTLVILTTILETAAENKTDKAKPAVLMIARSNSGSKRDFNYLKKLFRQGFQLDTAYWRQKERPFDWDLIRNYNCLILESLPLPEEKKGLKQGWNGPPYRKEIMDLLDRFLRKGGGVLFLPDLHGYSQTVDLVENFNTYLKPYGAFIPLESILDPPMVKRHPRSHSDFIYTENIIPSPVSKGVKGIWFPLTPRSYISCMQAGWPVEVDKNWQAVVRGSETSYTKNRELFVTKRSGSGDPPDYNKFPRRKDQKTPPTLFAIREYDHGRLALAAMFNVFLLAGGTSWMHDGVVLNQGLERKPSNFGKLFENTLSWLCEPSLKSGKLGGYKQNLKMLRHPHFRKKPKEFFPQFDSYQNPTPPGKVFRGLIGARTSFSGGKSTTAEYLQVALDENLDFVIFLEKFGKIKETDFRKLEAECRKLSNDKILLIPGYRMDNNIGNHLFFYGYDLKWPKPNQLDGPDKTQLRLQCFDKDGNIVENDGQAKNLLWANTSRKGLNVGYYWFDNKSAVAVRNLRLFGILGVFTYENGQLVDDVFKEYLNYTKDGNPPLVCSVNLVDSAAELKQAVDTGEFLTYVAAEKLADVPEKAHYGHQYGRANVYPSQGPEIRSWAQTVRIMTFAGEPFVTSRLRVRPLCWVTAKAGLKEIKIYSDGKLFRRLLFNGEKEFKHTFEWAFDRQRVLVLEVTDQKNQRAVSAGLEIWNDANYSWWCGDRQNGEMWHGPFIIPHAQYPVFSQGPTWDGMANKCFIGFDLWTHPIIKTTDRRYEGNRWMEGDVWQTCFDDSVANYAGIVDHVYAPGRVGNAYHTLGPRKPSEIMTFSLRRTQFKHRPTGPRLDGHAMTCERGGGNLSLFEGQATLREKTSVDYLVVGILYLRRFSPKDGNTPIYAIRRDENSSPDMGPAKAFREKILIQPGGYVAVVPTKLGNTCVFFNLGDGPLELSSNQYQVAIPGKNKEYSVGHKFNWKYLVVYDNMNRHDHRLSRIEEIRTYYKIGRNGGCGIEVLKGKLLKERGLVDLEAENSLIEFKIPKPKLKMDLPVGLRFFGFNPNWTIGHLQIEGYTTGFYTKGKNVYRNLAVDDRDIAYLEVFPEQTRSNHHLIGHPVQCDVPELFIQVTRLSDDGGWYVAVNNPTDRLIKTTLKKTMDLPGFEFPEQQINLPPGGFKVVLNQQPSKKIGAENQRGPRKRKDYVTGTKNTPDQSKGALKVKITDAVGTASHHTGALARLRKPVTPGKKIMVSFQAKWLSGARYLTVSRPAGGSTATLPVKLTSEWQAFKIPVKVNFETRSLLFSPVASNTNKASPPAADGEFLLDNVKITIDGKNPDGIGENLIVNGNFESNIQGWTGQTYNF